MNQSMLFLSAFVLCAGCLRTCNRIPSQELVSQDLSRCDLGKRWISIRFVDHNDFALIYSETNDINKVYVVNKGAVSSFWCGADIQSLPIYPKLQPSQKSESNDIMNVISNNFVAHSDQKCVLNLDMVFKVLPANSRFYIVLPRLGLVAFISPRFSDFDTEYSLAGMGFSIMSESDSYEEVVGSIVK